MNRQTYPVLAKQRTRPCSQRAPTSTFPAVTGCVSFGPAPRMPAAQHWVKNDKSILESDLFYH